MVRPAVLQQLPLPLAPHGSAQREPSPDVLIGEFGAEPSRPSPAAIEQDATGQTDLHPLDALAQWRQRVADFEQHRVAALAPLPTRPKREHVMRCRGDIEPSRVEPQGRGEHVARQGHQVDGHVRIGTHLLRGRRWLGLLGSRDGHGEQRDGECQGSTPWNTMRSDEASMRHDHRPSEPALSGSKRLVVLGRDTLRPAPEPCLDSARKALVNNRVGRLVAPERSSQGIAAMTLRSLRAPHRRGLLAAGLLLALGGCGGVLDSPRRGGGIGLFGGGSDPTLGTPRPPQQSVARAEPLAEEPSAAMQQVLAHLRRQGFSEVRAPKDLQVPPTGTTTFPIVARYGQCYVVVAVAPKGRNLDLVVLDPWGRSIAHDLRPDRHPWAAFCPSASGRYTVRLQAPPGSPTPLRIVTLKGAPTQNPALLAFFQAAEGGSAPVRTVGVPPSLSPRLAAYAQSFAAEGFQQGGAPVAVVAATGQGVDFDVEFPAPGCFRMALVGEGAGIQQVQAVLLGAQGEVLARTQGSGDAVLEHCVQAPSRGRLRAIPVQGAGPLAVAFFSKLASESTAGATAETGGIGAAQSAGGVEEQFALLDGDMRARGYTRATEPQRIEMNPNEHRTLNVDLQGGKCYAFLAVGDPVTIQDVDLAVGTPAGEMLDMDIAVDARPIVRVCPKQSAPYTVAITMQSGSGTVLFARYDWPRGIRGPFGLRGLAYVRLAENVALLASEDFVPDDAVDPIRSRFRRLDAPREHALPLRGGHCYAVLVVGGEGLRAVSAELEVEGTVVGRTPDLHLVPFLTLRYCTQRDVRATLRIVAPALQRRMGSAMNPALESRPGVYVVQLFRQEG